MTRTMLEAAQDTGLAVPLGAGVQIMRFEYPSLFQFSIPQSVCQDQLGITAPIGVYQSIFPPNKSAKRHVAPTQCLSQMSAQFKPRSDLCASALTL